MKFFWQEYCIGSCTVDPRREVPFSRPAYSRPTVDSAVFSGVPPAGLAAHMRVNQASLSVPLKVARFRKSLPAALFRV